MADSRSTIRQRTVREAIIAKLGGQCGCAQSNCHAHPGECGFSDIRALHIDHREGGGSAELRHGYGGGLAYYYRVRNDTTGRYQLLCANCNAIKRHLNREARGAAQHKQPARLRAGLQVDGQQIRRVKRAPPVAGRNAKL